MRASMTRRTNRKNACRTRRHVWWFAVRADAPTMLARLLPEGPITAAFEPKYASGDA